MLSSRRNLDLLPFVVSQWSFRIDRRRRISRLSRLCSVLALVVLLGTACGSEPGGSVTTSDAGTHPDDQPATSEAPSSTVSDPQGDLRLIVLPDVSGRMPAEVELGCPSGPTFPASALDEIRPLTGAGLDEIEIAIREFLSSAEGEFWPQNNWQILHETATTVLLVNQDQGNDSDGAAEASSFAFQTVERVGDHWRWAGSSSGGSCPLRTSVPRGSNTVDWRIDPAAQPLTSSSTRIELLATERECASGQAMGERLMGPEIVTTETAVFIAFAAVPPPGLSQNCQGNPEQPVVVELDAPLGNRVVADGLAVAGHLEDFLN